MRKPAQTGALIFGVVFLLFGILGLFVPNGMGLHADNASTGKVLGLFPVNLLHNLVHLAFGAWGLIAARSIGGARTYGIVGAAIYALLVVVAFISPTLFGLVPIGSHDFWLHAVLAAGLAYVAGAARA